MNITQEEYDELKKCQTRLEWLELFLRYGGNIYSIYDNLGTGGWITSIGQTVESEESEEYIEYARNSDFLKCIDDAKIVFDKKMEEYQRQDEEMDRQRAIKYLEKRKKFLEEYLSITNKLEILK